MTVEVASRAGPGERRSRCAEETATVPREAAASQATLDALLCELLPRQGCWSDEGYLWLTDHGNRPVEWGIAIGPPRQGLTCTRRLVDPVKVGTVGGEHSHLALRRDVDALRAIRHVGHCLPGPGHFIGDLADLVMGGR